MSKVGVTLASRFGLPLMGKTTANSAKRWKVGHIELWEIKVKITSPAETLSMYDQTLVKEKEKRAWQPSLWTLRRKKEKNYQPPSGKLKEEKKKKKETKEKKKEKKKRRNKQTNKQKKQLTASHPSVKGQRPQDRWIGATRNHHRRQTRCPETSFWLQSALPVTGVLAVGRVIKNRELICVRKQLTNLGLRIEFFSYWRQAARHEKYLRAMRIPPVLAE